MKWATFTTKAGESPRVGVVQDNNIRAAPSGTTMLDCFGDSREAFNRAGAALLGEPAETFDLETVVLEPPVPSPPSVRDFMVFEEHLSNANRALAREIDDDWYELPVFYFTNPAAIRADRDAVPIAPGSDRFDYEAELAAIIGWPGSHVNPEQADALIAGYCLFIDWSARDLQAREMRQGLGPTKGKDTATTLGPMLVTPDELEPYRVGRGFELDVSVTVGDRRYSTGSFAAMHWSFDEMIAYASRGTQVRPGDIIGSGTCGQGCILELQHLYGEEQYRWLRPGDEVTVEATQLGRLTNTLVEGETPHPLRVQMPRDVASKA